MAISSLMEFFLSFCFFFCLDAKETKNIRRFFIVFSCAYEVASLSSRTTCLPDRQARSAPRVCPAGATKGNSIQSFGRGFRGRKQLFFCLFFCLDAKETKNQGQPDRSARLSGQRHQTTLLNSNVLVIIPAFGMK